MDRQIKFRGKRTDNGEWVYGSLYSINQGEDWYIKVDSEKSSGNISVDPSTVGQFTCLKDRNGKEIFEGDFVKVLRGSPEALANIYQIKYINAAFQMLGNGNKIPTAFVTYAKQCIDHGVEFEEIGDLIEVIGNVHSNPELL